MTQSPLNCLHAIVRLLCVFSHMPFGNFLFHGTITKGQAQKQHYMLGLLFMASSEIALFSGVPSIELGDIAEIRAGHGTDTFNKIVKQARESSGRPDAVPRVDDVNCARGFAFSLIFRDDTPPLDLVAEDGNVRNLWVDALSHLVVTIRSLGQQKEYEL